MKIWVDADACPKVIREIIFKASLRLQVPVCLVANSYLEIPRRALVSFVLVTKGPDVADQHIADHVEAGDLVITADIPLAAAVVEKLGTALSPRGELFTEENARARLSMRDFMQGLRDSGVETGGPAALGPRDRVRFASAFDAVLTRLLAQGHA